MDLEKQLDRLERMLNKHDVILITDKWPGPIRRAMANAGIVQGINGYPEVYNNREGKTLMAQHAESYEMRIKDLSTRHVSLKADYSSLKEENAKLRLEIERLKHGDGVNGEVYEGKLENTPLLERIN